MNWSRRAVVVLTGALLAACATVPPPVAPTRGDSFAGRMTVRVDAACLDCGDPVTVEMRDGRITWADPPEVVGHLAFGFGASRGRSYYL